MESRLRVVTFFSIVQHAQQRCIGQTIVLVHDPPRITCHSIQTGKVEREIPLADGYDSVASLTGVWWFTEEKTPASTIPDIFKRSGVEVRSLI